MTWLDSPDPRRRLAGFARSTGSVFVFGTVLAVSAAAAAPGSSPAAPATTPATPGVLYKVTRPDGSVLFTDQAPDRPGIAVDRLRLPRTGPAPAAPSAEQSRRYWAEQDRAFQARHEARRQADEAREVRLAEERRRAGPTAAEAWPPRRVRPARPVWGYPAYPVDMHQYGANYGVGGSVGVGPGAGAPGVASPYTSSPGAANGRGGGFIGSGFATSTR